MYHRNVLGDNHLVNGRTAKGMLLSGSGSGGLVVRVLALYYNDSGLDPAEGFIFFAVKCCQKQQK